jgi:hypothetical protein
VDSTTKKAASRQVKTVEAYHTIFSSPDGEMVLNDLINKHWVLKSTNSSGASDSEVIFREGERNVVLRILSILKTSPAKLRERIDTYVKDME